MDASDLFNCEIGANVDLHFVWMNGRTRRKPGSQEKRDSFKCHDTILYAQSLYWKVGLHSLRRTYPIITRR